MVDAMTSDGLKRRGAPSALYASKKMSSRARVSAKPKGERSPTSGELLAFGGFSLAPGGGRLESVRGLALFDTGGLLLGRRPITCGCPLAELLGISPITGGLDNDGGGLRALGKSLQDCVEDFRTSCRFMGISRHRG